MQRRVDLQVKLNAGIWTQTWPSFVYNSYYSLFPQIPGLKNKVKLKQQPGNRTYIKTMF